jgi:hypothetical protein
MLQIVSWNEPTQAVTNTLCISHLFKFSYKCLAGNAGPMGHFFLLKFSLKDYSVQKKCVDFVACCLNEDLKVKITHLSSLGLDFHM